MNHLKYTKSCFENIDPEHLEGWEEDPPVSHHGRSGSLLRQLQDNLNKYGERKKVKKEINKSSIKLPCIRNNPSNGTVKC